MGWNSIKYNVKWGSLYKVIIYILYIYIYNYNVVVIPWYIHCSKKDWKHEWRKKKFRSCEYLSLCLSVSYTLVYIKAVQGETVLFTSEREQLPCVMMHFQSLPPFWWTCGTENTEISAKRESYFSTWLNWFRGGFCVQSICLMDLLLLAVPKSTTNICSIHRLWKCNIWES